MATGGETYSVGYDDNRFEIVVSERFHCPICFQVLRDPVMCENQHSYCSPCIKKYLEDGEASCPVCRVPLSVDILSEAPRLVRDYLSELNIRCDFYDQGCPEIVQVGDLERHLASCGFFPVPCSNDGCNVVVNKREKLYHEAQVCDFRRWKCYDCGELKKELLARQDQMKTDFKSEIRKMEDELKEMKKQMEAVMKNSKQSSTDARGNIFVAGGHHLEGPGVVRNKPTEYFNWSDQTWRRLNSAAVEGRSSSCSFLYQGQMVVAGGHDGVNETNTVKCLNLADPAATWEDFHVNLPVNCSGHKVVHCDDRLYMSGVSVQATDERQGRHTGAVYEVQLVPPFASKMLTRLQRPRSGHGMHLYDEKLFILGGSDDWEVRSRVVQYDLIKNECKEMPPLPYAVRDMATVLWRNNVLVLGGRDAKYNPLNTVVMYDVITGRSQMLPCMKRQRHCCTAVLTGNVVVVIGGMNERDVYLKSVECFDLERQGGQAWQDLPDMLEPRAFATAVVKPNH